MKIKNKILLTFLTFIVMIVILVLSISIFLRYNYMDIKNTIARNYYDNNDITLDEYANYLLDKGFVVTSSRLETYKDYGTEVCPYQEEPIVVYDENKSPILYAVINNNVVKDNLILIDYLLAFITILILILLIVVYLLINKLIIRRIEYVEKTVKEYNNDLLDDIINKLDIDNYNDEISSLKTEFKNLLIAIKDNEKNKQMLVMALSHELKSPITKIEAILDMYLNNIDNYNDKKKVINLIENETEYMNVNISRLLEFYKNYDVKYKKEKINLNKVIKELFEKDLFFNKQENLKIIEDSDFELYSDVKRVEIIINNIKENIIKHAFTKENVTITINAQEVKFTNKILPKNKHSTKVGNIINDFLINDMNLEMTRHIQSEYYIVTINKKS